MFPGAGLRVRTTLTRRPDMRVSTLIRQDALRSRTPSTDGADSRPSGFGRPPTRAALNDAAPTHRAGDAESETGDLPATGRGEPHITSPTPAGRCGPPFDASRWNEPTGWARWFLALVLGAGLLALELAVFDHHLNSELQALRSAGQSASSSAATTPSLTAPTIPAPLAGGPITAVDLRAMARCEPAMTCPSRLQVRVLPAPQPRRMRWVYQITDRCTGRTQLAPGGSITIGAGNTQATVVNGIQLPVGRAFALNALLEEPTRVASPTLLAPAAATC